MGSNWTCLGKLRLGGRGLQSSDLPSVTRKWKGAGAEQQQGWGWTSEFLGSGQYEAQIGKLGVRKVVKSCHSRSGWG